MEKETIDNITKQIQDKFNKIKFDPELHRYTVGGKVFPSVSGLIKAFVEPFNTKLISKMCAKAEGISQKEILDRWEKIKVDACNYGTRVHDFAERYVIDRYNLNSDLKYYGVYQHLKPGEELTPKEKAVIKFWDDKPEFYVPIILELQMYSEQYEYAGTADIILLDTRDMSLVIGDYKTNKDLFKNYKNKSLLGRFSHMLDMPLSKYELQLSFYQILLEQAGFKISRRFLCWVQEEKDEYKKPTGEGFYTIYNTPDHTEELRQHLIERNNVTSW